LTAIAPLLPATPRWRSPDLASLAYNIRRNPKIAVGGTVLVVMLFVAVFAPFLGTGDPRALSVSERLAEPSAAHIMGTDLLGRDLYTRVLYGGRVSLQVGFFAALFSSISGGIIGLACASSRLADGVIMRIMDGLMSIPAILLAIALVAIAGGSVQNVVLGVVIVETPRVSRLVRSVVLSLKEMPYVEAAVASGSSTLKILWRHLAPGIVAPLAVQATFCWAAAMLIEAALSFIGAGTPPSTPSWGNIMADGKALWQVKPSLIFIPALFLSVTVLGVNLLGDGLRRALDPKNGSSR
jgi:peptide/nickel transport system permease protein